MAESRSLGVSARARFALAPRSTRLRGILKAWYVAVESALVRRCLGYEPARLLGALRALGVERGDTVLVHAAFRRANGFAGGPQDLIAVLSEAVGPEGNLAMVSMAYRGSSLDYLRSGATFDVRRTVSRMGIVSEVFRRMAGVRRSGHPLHPILVRGPRADWIVAGHERLAYSCGPGSPFEKMLEIDAKVLFFDVGFGAFTFTHYLEDRFRAAAPVPVYASAPMGVDFVDGSGRPAHADAFVFDREAIRRRDWSVLRDALERRRQLKRARIGATRLLLVRMRDACDRAEEIVARGGHFYGRTDTGRGTIVRRVRASAWEARATFERASRLVGPSSRRFLAVVAADHMRFLRGENGGIRGETLERARAAERWLALAQDATPDDGVAYGWFPCGANGCLGWVPSYPESTGYIIPTLLAYAERFGDDDARRRALRMARWETEVQMPNGAVRSGHVGAPGPPAPAAFNTGMVLLGMVDVLRTTWDPGIFESARRMASFLCDDVTDEGYFRTHGPRVTPARVKTYECLCAWPLFAFGRETGCTTSTRTAVRIAEAALRRQQGNGWFADNCLSWPEMPLLHTIAYTLQGLLETAVLAGREDFLRAVRRGVAPLLARLEADGALRARYAADWTPASRSVCLTGNAQLAVVCFRLFEETHEAAFRGAADRIVDALKVHQVVDTPCAEAAGALAGSHPIFGPYMQGGYPNWATKFLLDALLMQERHARAGGAAAASPMRPTTA